MNRRRIGGCDEVGFGAFFGPVVAACVVIELSMEHLLIGAKVKDSKKVTSEKKRVLLSDFIKANAIAWGIGEASVAEIEMMGIDRASHLAMKRSVLALPQPPDGLIIDGLYEIPNLEIPQEAIVDGDELEPIISAASIVAKVYRDDLICKLSERYPDYDLAQNKGYGTPKHRATIAELGLTPSHRPLFCRKYSTKYNQNAIAHLKTGSDLSQAKNLSGD
jgi:ribonuclease HII